MRELGASEPQETSRYPPLTPKDCAGCSFLPVWLGLVERGRETWGSRASSHIVFTWRWRTRSPDPQVSPPQAPDRLTGGCGPALPQTSLPDSGETFHLTTVLERPRAWLSPSRKRVGAARGAGTRPDHLLPFRPRSIELPPCPLAGGSGDCARWSFLLRHVRPTSQSLALSGRALNGRGRRREFSGHSQWEAERHKGRTPPRSREECFCLFKQE